MHVWAWLLVSLVELGHQPIHQLTFLVSADDPATVAEGPVRRSVDTGAVT